MKPLWRGPYKDGVTQSLLQVFIRCPHQFWLKTIPGWEVLPRFEFKRDYGSMMHEGHEVFCNSDSLDDINLAINKKSKEYQNDNPDQMSSIKWWTDMAVSQYDVYRRLYRKIDAKKNYIGAEEEFNFKHELPDSGRVVILRGKLDGVYTENGQVWLQENKTHGFLNPAFIEAKLSGDLQVHLYSYVLSQYHDNFTGCLYNVVKRPSDRFRQGKSETYPQFHDRLKKRFLEDSHEFFARIVYPISEDKINRFLDCSLDPILERLCNWYDSIEGLEDPFDSPLHYIRPLGIFEGEHVGMDGEFARMLSTGSTAGYQRSQRLFKELECQM